MVSLHVFSWLLAPIITCYQWHCVENAEQVYPKCPMKYAKIQGGASFRCFRVKTAVRVRVFNCLQLFIDANLMHNLCAILVKWASELIPTMYAFKLHNQQDAEALDLASNNDWLVNYVVGKSYRVALISSLVEILEEIKVRYVMLSLWW